MGRATLGKARKDHYLLGEGCPLAQKRRWEPASPTQNHGKNEPAEGEQVLSSSIKWGRAWGCQEKIGVKHREQRPLVYQHHSRQDPGLLLRTLSGIPMVEFTRSSCWASHIARAEPDYGKQLAECILTESRCVPRIGPRRLWNTSNYGIRIGDLLNIPLNQWKPRHRPRVTLAGISLFKSWAELLRKWLQTFKNVLYKNKPIWF